MVTHVLSIAAAVLVVVLAILLPDLAAAQDADDDQARLHFDVAAGYYERGEYESALHEFRSAYQLSRRPELQYNLALCYQQLGRLDEAITALERYLSEVTDIENRANLEVRLANLRERRNRRREPGPVREVSGSSETAQASEAEQAIDTSTSINVLAIAGFGVAAVGLVSAVIFSSLAVAEDGRLSGLPCAATSTCAESEVSTLDTFTLVSDISWGLSLAGAIAGAVFLFVWPGPSETHAGLRLAPVVGPTTGVSLTGGF
jgi:hypothetical protein